MDVVLKYYPELSPTQVDQLKGLKEIYQSWNEKINVISRKDMDNFYVHHVLHSLAIATQFDFPPGTHVLDLGTGGGFPGVPLAIIFPEVNFHLVDSVNKKLTVVKEVTNKLEIKNVTTQHIRAEDVARKKFDMVVSRAVAPLKNLWQWSKPLIRKQVTGSTAVNGLICLKGGDLASEIAESACKPHIWEIKKIFEEEYFENKFILFQPVY